MCIMCFFCINGSTQESSRENPEQSQQSKHCKESFPETNGEGMRFVLWARPNLHPSVRVGGIAPHR